MFLPPSALKWRSGQKVVEGLRSVGHLFLQQKDNKKNYCLFQRKTQVFAAVCVLCSAHCLLQHNAASLCFFNIFFMFKSTNTKVKIFFSVFFLNYLCKQDIYSQNLVSIQLQKTFAWSFKKKKRNTAISSLFFQSYRESLTAFQQETKS